MGAYRQAFLDVRPTAMALLRREARGDADHLMAGSFSPVFKDAEKRAPTGVVNALGTMMVAHHPADIQVLHADAAVPLGIVLGGLAVEVAPLATDLQMLARDFPIRFAATMATLLAAAHPALPMRPALLGLAVMAPGFPRAPLRVRPDNL